MTYKVRAITLIPGSARSSGAYDDKHADGVWRELPKVEVMPHVVEAFIQGHASQPQNVKNCPHEGWLWHTWEGGSSTYGFCRTFGGKWFVCVEPI